MVAQPEQKLTARADDNEKKREEGKTQSPKTKSREEKIEMVRF